MPEVIWNLFMELRKELVEAQKIRAQILGFKFTFITAGMGIIGANLATLDKKILIVPALAAIFFDFLIYSYSFSIKRIGVYIREEIEPVMKASQDIPEGFTMWQEYLRSPNTRQYLAAYGNVGVTGLAAVLGLAGLVVDFSILVSPVLLIVLVVFLYLDIKAYLEPGKLGIWDKK